MNTGAWIGEDRHDMIQQTVGINGLVPIVNLVKLISNLDEGKLIFNKVLKLISIALNNVEEYDT